MSSVKKGLRESVSKWLYFELEECMKIVTDVVKLYRLPSMYLTEGSWYYLGEFYDFFFFF